MEGVCLRCGEALNEDDSQAAEQAAEKVESEEAETALCSRCRLDPPPFERCFAPFAYRPPVDKLIANYKFHADHASGYALSRILARIMARRWRGAQRPDLLLPVPLHKARLRARGFNQALEIAKVLAVESGTPLCARGLRKLRPTPPQTEMRNARQRGANIRATFGIAEGGRLRAAYRVVLVDDVVTTMSTVSELTRVLKLAGVGEVEVCCLARAGL